MGFPKRSYTYVERLREGICVRRGKNYEEASRSGEGYREKGEVGLK